jgi:hypothetical protein
VYFSPPLAEFHFEVKATASSCPSEQWEVAMFLKAFLVSGVVELAVELQEEA